MPCLEIILFTIQSLNYFVWAIIIIYFLIIVASWIGWQNTAFIKPKQYNKNVFVSVVIAARNEDENLPKVLSDLKQQTYPTSLSEWIIVDDHSDNKISGLVCFDNSPFENLVIIELEENYKGKKEALRVGAERSKGELLIFTDADCRIQPQWIESIVGQYEMKKPAIIIGLINYHHQKGLLSHFFRFDLMSLVITGSGLASLGFPVMCNGANLAVERDLYLKSIQTVRPEITSGDDIFLLHSIKKDKNARIDVLKSRESMVFTNAPSNLREFLNQHIRWASKSWSYTDSNTIILAGIVLSTNLILIGELISAISTGNYHNLVYMGLIKVMADCLIITAGLSYFGKKRNLILFPLFSVIYPFYFLLVFILSLIGIFTWKDRVIKTG